MNCCDPSLHSPNYKKCTTSDNEIIDDDNYSNAELLMILRTSIIKENYELCEHIKNDLIERGVDPTISDRELKVLQSYTNISDYLMDLNLK